MPPTFSFRRVAVGLWLALFPLFILLLSWPVSSTKSRIATLATLGMILFGAIFFLLPHRKLLLISVCVLAAVAGWMLLPFGGTVPSGTLRSAYVEALRSYTDCPYVWGGESSRGIDCSGLIRRAMIDAQAKYGLQTLSPKALREAVALWWEDATARDMGEGYGGRMVKVTKAQRLNDADYSLILPGDVAVTESGIHVIAYLGEGQWIGADPGETKVTIFRLPSENGYFSIPMNVMRWTQLDR